MLFDRLSRTAERAQYVPPIPRRGRKEYVVVYTVIARSAATKQSYMLLRKYRKRAKNNCLSEVYGIMPPPEDRGGEMAHCTPAPTEGKVNGK